jgi:6-pyruvoyltetrahydropterin/6-carboxytetrahydropterin synthase
VRRPLVPWLVAATPEVFVFTLELAKEDFKFSSAHFTLFDAECGELLHGHNYQVAVRASGRRLDDLELLLDIAPLKERIRELCADLDSRTLLPAQSPHLRFTVAAGEIEVRFQSRRYLFPEADTRVLPLRNISVESLARFLWQRLVASLDTLADVTRLEGLGVAVQETAGQRCWFESPLQRAPAGKRRRVSGVDASARRKERRA